MTSALFAPIQPCVKLFYSACPLSLTHSLFIFQDHKPASSSAYQSVPLDKIEDFGAHANEYYPLKVSIFKSSLDGRLLDLLWEKYWVKTLSGSPLITVSPWPSPR